MFVVEHTIEDPPVCAAMYKGPKFMVAKIIAQVAANIVKLFVQTYVLQSIPFLDLELVMCPYHPLIPSFLPAVSD